MKHRKNPCRDGCRDKDLTGHWAYVGCSTPYCSSSGEVHCRRCGFFQTSCNCGSNNGYDTISNKARRSIARRRSKK